MNSVDNTSRRIRELKLSPGVIASNNHIALRTLSPYSNTDQFARDAADITVWRNMYPDAYLTVFNSTWGRTRSWLSASYKNNDTDLMLMVVDKYGVSFGHFSFINFTDEDVLLTCELSRVVRGPGLGPQGGMERGILMGLEWCSRELGVHRCNLRVFSDNERAIRLYNALGFRETMRTSLTKRPTEDGYEWIHTKSAPSERTEILMTLELSED